MSIHAVPGTDRDQAIQAVDNYLRICMPGKPLKVEIKEWKEDRSTQQNAALWAAAYPPIMEATGLRGAKDRDDLHAYFCGEYWGWVETELFGRKKQNPARTTTHNYEGKREVISWEIMSAFYSFIQQRAAEHGIYVPDPDPAWRERAKIDAEEEARS